MLGSPLIVLLKPHIVHEKCGCLPGVQGRWFTIYVVVVISFGCSLRVLFRNHRAGIDIPFYYIKPSDCENMDTHMESVYQAVRFLVEATLSGGMDWQCFRSSSSDTGGVLLAVSMHICPCVTSP